MSKLDQVLSPKQPSEAQALQDGVRVSVSIQREAMYRSFLEDQHAIESRAECRPLVRWAKHDLVEHRDQGVSRIFMPR